MNGFAVWQRRWIWLQERGHLTQDYSDDAKLNAKHVMIMLRDGHHPDKGGSKETAQKLSQLLDQVKAMR